MRPLPLFRDLSPRLRVVPRALTLRSAQAPPVRALSDKAFRAWTLLRLTRRPTPAKAEALLRHAGLLDAVPELQTHGYLTAPSVEMTPTSKAPASFSGRVPIVVDHDALVLSHLPLVTAVAGRLKRRLPPSVALDDLVTAGHIALVKAARRYDPALGVPFGAFARRRISGAMLDQLRAMDPIGRRHRRAVTAGEASFHEVPLTSGGQLDERSVTHPALTARDDIAATEASCTVTALLERLPASDRELVRRVAIDEDAWPDVAAALGISRDEARARYAAALQALRAMVQSQADTPQR